MGLAQITQSHAWKNFMAKLYGIGASVVIVGALFKIMHWPGAGPMLIAGLGTEAIIFFFSAFEPLHEELDWTLVYPQLSGLDEGDELPPLEKTKPKNEIKLEESVKENKKLQTFDDSSVPEEEISNNEVKKEEPPKPPKFTGKSTDMPTKLAQERKPIKKLIMEDCVQLGLISKKRAKYVVTQMAGKKPVDAEKEVVIELRENLHKQVRELIRKDKDNPWSSPKAQEELRLEIVNTPTVRSVLFLTRDIYREREEWLKKSHNSITGRIFGSKMGLDKK
jgi:hypothetical protein